MERGSSRLIVGSLVSLLLHVGFAWWLAAAPTRADARSAGSMLAEDVQPPEATQTDVRLGEADSEAIKVEWLGVAEEVEPITAPQGEFSQSALAPNAAGGGGGAPAQPVAAARPQLTTQSQAHPQANPDASVQPVAQPPTQPLTNTPTPTLPAPRAEQRPDPSLGPVLTLPPAEEGERVRGAEGENVILAPSQPPLEDTPALDPITASPQVSAAESKPKSKPDAEPEETPDTETPDTETPAPVAPPTQPSPAVPTAVPSPPVLPSQPAPVPNPGEGVGPGQGPSRGEGVGDQPGTAANKESDPLAKVITVRTDEKRVQAGKGLEIRTVRPKFNYVTRLTVSPRNPLVIVEFGADGRVKKCSFDQDPKTKRVFNSGSASIDEAIVRSVYSWTAVGKDLQTLRPDERLTLRIRIWLVR